MCVCVCVCVCGEGVKGQMGPRERDKQHMRLCMRDKWDGDWPRHAPLDLGWFSGDVS